MVFGPACDGPVIGIEPERRDLFLQGEMRTQSFKPGLAFIPFPTIEMIRGQFTQTDHSLQPDRQTQLSESEPERTFL